MPVIDLNKIKVQTKWQAFKDRMWIKAQMAANWIRNNPETVGIAMTVGTAVIGGAVKIGKGAIRHRNLRKEQFNKERYIYDRSLGMYLRTKRPLRNKDYLTINARRKNGEKLSDILADMHVLE